MWHYFVGAIPQRGCSFAQIKTFIQTVTEQGNYALAERYYQEGLTLARSLGYRKQLSVLYNDLGYVLGSRFPGAYEEANICFQESLDLARGLGALWYISNVLTEWGGIHLKYQQVDAAFELFHEVSASETLAETEPVMVGLTYYLCSGQGENDCHLSAQIYFFLN